VLRGLSWDAYLQILNALPQSRAARLTYDDGILEITVPLELHEFSGRLIERFIWTLVKMMGLKIKTIGASCQLSTVNCQLFNTVAIELIEP